MAKSPVMDLLAKAFTHVKQAFIPGAAGDPAAMAGGGDPSMGGGMPPGGGMDPSMMGGMPPGGDPSMGGGAPPAPLPPPPPPAPAPAPAPQVGPDGNVIKPKVDVNVEIMKMENMLAKIMDSMGIAMPVQDMVATPEKLTNLANGQPTAAPASAIAPISPIAPAMPKAASWDPYRFAVDFLTLNRVGC